MEKYLEEITKPFSAGQPRKEALSRLLGLLDLTTLDGTDNPEKVNALCNKALSFSANGFPSPAAVCVYPPFAALVSAKLSGSGIFTASVAGAFPSGQLPVHLKVAEADYAVAHGADEIDMVISRGTFLAGDYNTIVDEVAAMKMACGNAHLKVILETGELVTPGNIRLASQLAIEGGADFIKTSTGKMQPAATPEAMAVMLDAIKEHFENTGVKIGIKPAGGISTPEQALVYYALVSDKLGDEWLKKSLFRIGASRLADAIVNELSDDK
ncbi:MAG TPA: deoxyribose-phosphate aldolase [Bacteroidales bacterium]|nr:deoxyribose-phosphate aldolase [Bacteroidales bacterium]